MDNGGQLGEIMFIVSGFCVFSYCLVCLLSQGCIVVVVCLFGRMDLVLMGSGCRVISNR